MVRLREVALAITHQSRRLQVVALERAALTSAISLGVIAGLSGLAALAAGVAKIFNQNSGLSQLLQPLRNFLAQFNIKF
ncbi:hypothetical protein ACQX4L_05230 [Corynebacterium diphtheriae]|nr:hypothetical protein [Corynebacterium diphtheriae]